MRIALRNWIAPVALLAGCVAPVGEGAVGPEGVSGGKTDSSAVAVFLDMELDGELRTTYDSGLESQIESQLFYTVGHLNQQDSVARLDRTQLSDVRVDEEGEGYVIRYHAKLQVAWGKRDDIPQTYRFRLPANNSYGAFFDKYKDSCLDGGAHDPTSGIMWYYYRPDRSGCSLEAADVLDVTATVRRSDIETTGKYPEYTKVWEDDALRVVAIFGKYEEGATSDWDAGISAYNEFIRTMDRSLRNAEIVGENASALTTEPETLPDAPGVGTPDITFRVTLADGKTIEVVAMLVDSIRSTSDAFNRRYESLTERADFIGYNGHAGLGENVRALARKGSWVTGQYAIVFINGCDTYAYLDEALHTAHSEINEGDLSGTQHLDLVTNAMPAYFRSMSGGSVAFIHAFARFETPKTYEQIFADIDDDQVVLVSGEQDNVFQPGDPIGSGE